MESKFKKGVDFLTDITTIKGSAFSLGVVC